MPKSVSSKKTVRISKIDPWLRPKNFLVVVFAVAFGAVGATLFNYSFAAKPSVTLGSCSASPNPVAVGADYTVTGTNLGAGTLVNVLESDAGGITSWNLQADAQGTTSVTWHSYYKGTTSVKFQVKPKHNYVNVASCAFNVI